MNIYKWEFDALDTWFFREAAPFNAGEGGQGGQSSLFPPSMNTIQGAVRYLLAWERGWRPGLDNWPPELGDNEDLGNLQLYGPYLYLDDKLLLPSPLFLMRRPHNITTGYHRLYPGPEAVRCDLGTVRLLKMPEGAAGAKSMENYWLSSAAWGKVTAGGVPQIDEAAENTSDLPADGVCSNEQLWKTESKVGIAREAENRTAQSSHLYAINMVRPLRSLKLVVGVSGIAPEWMETLASPQVVSLGGEGKLAALTVTDEPIKLPAMPDLKPVKGKVRFTITLITPGYFGDELQTAMAAKDLQPGINADCITVCLGRAKQIGGWDLKLNRPRPLRSFIPAGSTWFFEGEEGEINAIKKLHGRFVGEKKSNAYGYGQILLGRWEEEK